MTETFGEVVGVLVTLLVILPFYIITLPIIYLARFVTEVFGTPKTQVEGACPDSGNDKFGLCYNGYCQHCNVSDENFVEKTHAAPQNGVLNRNKCVNPLEQTQ